MTKFDNLKIIDFPYNINNKLLSFNFISIRPTTEEFVVGQRYLIKINDIFYCYSDLIDLKKLSLKEIIIANYNILDSGKNEKIFKEEIYNKFKNKKWFNQDETIMQVLFLQKITQTNIFDFI